MIEKIVLKKSQLLRKELWNLIRENQSLEKPILHLESFSRTLVDFEEKLEKEISYKQQLEKRGIA